MQAKLRILIVDDHPLMREALRAAIEDEEDLLVAGEASNGLQAIEQATRLQPDVIVMDLFMPAMGGVEAIRSIREACPETHILTLTSSSDESLVLGAVEAGALGYLIKDTQRADLLNAIREVGQGNAFLPPQLARKLMEGMRRSRAQAVVTAEGDKLVETLTEREREVLRLIGEGASNREIAAILFVTEGTVRTHVHHILNKLDLKNRNQAILYALHNGLSKGHSPEAA